MMDKISRLPENGTFEASEKEQADMQLTAKATNGANDNNPQLTYDVDLLQFLRPCKPKTSSSKKNKPKPKVAELKKMENLSEPKYQPLDKLSPDELMDTVVSTYYEPNFMHPKIETIISHHWDDIFSKTNYNWRVVLQEPDNVMVSCPNHITFLCQPFPKCKGMYKAVLLDTRGKVSSRLSHELPVTLKEAVKMCEEGIHSKWVTEVVLGVLRNLSRVHLIDDKDYSSLLGTWEEYSIMRGFSLDNILAKLKSLGLSDENIEHLKKTSLKHAYYVLNKLTNDVVPAHDELVKAMKFYHKVKLLSKRDLWWVFEDEPLLWGLTEASSRVKKSLSLECTNFDKLTTTAQKELRAEIHDMVNNRIKEFLQRDSKRN